MATPPPISPVVATPLAHRKRRHSEIDAVAADDHQIPQPKIADADDKADTPDGSGHSQEESDGRDDADDDDEEEEDQELVEDILDAAELDPYQPDEFDKGCCLQADAASELRKRLLDVGPQVFWEETMAKPDMSPALLGTAFGLAPDLEDQLGEEMFIHILGLTITRFCNKRQKLPQYNTIDDVAALLEKSRNIMVITGAGISTSLGIPDFRSKGTGFYSKLLDADIIEPEDVFDIFEFDHDPSTFFRLARDLIPDETRTSPTHAFIRLLQDKGRLQTNYTQNIDNIEERAGIDKHRLIQCHGSFATASCRKCKHQVKGTEIFPDIRAQRVARCARCIELMATSDAPPAKKKAKPNHRPFRTADYDNDDDDDSTDDNIPEPGVMKPDITFFGEQLPDTFFTRLTERDAKSVDLVLVIGTSLKVAPVSEIPNYLPRGVPHIYISREPIEHVNFDVQLLGDCDTVVFELCRRAGWDLRHEMIPEGLDVDVHGVEGSEYRWDVTARLGTPEPRYSAVNGEDFSGA